MNGLSEDCRKKTGYRWCLAVVISLMTGLLVPAIATAADLDARIAEMIDTLEQEMVAASGNQRYAVAVGPFFDQQSGASTPLTRTVEDAMLGQMLQACLGRKDVIVFDWKRRAPLTAGEELYPGQVAYRIGDAADRLGPGVDHAFLIVGYTRDADPPGVAVELVDLTTGTVIANAGEPAAVAFRSADSPKPVPAPQAAGAAGSGPVVAATEVPERPRPAPEPAATGAPTPTPGDTAAIAALPIAVIEGKDYRYEGQVKDGKKHGSGTLISAGGDSYTGDWREDRMHGRGIYTFADGDTYDGQWQAGRMHGRGTYSYKNGDRYVGQWENDQRNGPGTYYFESGDRWDGTYVSGKKHGTAVYTWVNGRSKEEEWVEGRLVE